MEEINSGRTLFWESNSIKQTPEDNQEENVHVTLMKRGRRGAGLSDNVNLEPTSLKLSV